MDMDLTGPTWLKTGFRLCVLTAAYKTLVKYMGFYPDDLMMSVVIPALILAIVLAVLWVPLNMIWLLFWDVQEEFRAAPRLLVSLTIGLGVFLMGTLFNWQLWTFPEEHGQLLVLYWWDSVCAFCAMYALYCLHEYSVEDTDGESAFSTAMFTSPCSTWWARCRAFWSEPSGPCISAIFFLPNNSISSSFSPP